jgi:phage-related protein
MSEIEKPLAWLHGEVKTPPFSAATRVEVGVLLRRLQRGEMLSLPLSRPLPSIGPRCHELRVTDTQAKRAWRLVYYLGREAIVVLDVFSKTTRATPPAVLRECRRRLAKYQRDAGEVS